jgi:hypothetical protein
MAERSGGAGGRYEEPDRGEIGRRREHISAHGCAINIKGAGSGKRDYLRLRFGRDDARGALFIFDFFVPGLYCRSWNS